MTRNRCAPMLLAVAIALPSPATGGQRSMTFEGRRNRLPQWSPDGTRLAFLSDREERTQVYVVPRAAGEPRPVTRHETPVQAFRWSPDGTTIAFTAVDPVDDAEQKARAAGDDAQVIDATFDWP